MKIRLSYCLTCTILKFIESVRITNIANSLAFDIQAKRNIVFESFFTSISDEEKNHSFNRSDFNSQLLFLLIMIRQYGGIILSSAA